jgi:hypothetical protein
MAPESVGGPEKRSTTSGTSSARSTGSGVSAILPAVMRETSSS